MSDYFGLDRIISIILLIIPFTCWLLGVLTRCQEKKYVAAILRIVFGGWVLWICDLVNSLLLNKCNVKIVRVIDC